MNIHSTYGHDAQACVRKPMPWSASVRNSNIPTGLYINKHYTRRETQAVSFIAGGSLPSIFPGILANRWPAETGRRSGLVVPQVTMLGSVICCILVRCALAARFSGISSDVVQNPCKRPGRKVGQRPLREIVLRRRRGTGSIMRDISGCWASTRGKKNRLGFGRVFFKKSRKNGPGMLNFSIEYGE